MRFCSSCGSALTETAAFCENCGAASPGNTSATAQAAGGANALSSPLAAALAYALGAITGLFFLLKEPYRRDRYTRFHSLQSILYYLAAAVFWVAYMIASALLRVISFGFSIWFTLPASIVLSLGLFAYWIFLMYKAYRGESYKIPYLGDIAASASEPDDLPSSVAGALTYTLGFVTGIVFLLVEPFKRDSFVRFNAFQSIFASIACFLIAVCWGILTGALFFASVGALWLLLLFVWLAIRAAMCVGWIYLIHEAYQGKRVMIPVIAELAAKQAG
jgi:uncharacterized membrane protein